MLEELGISAGTAIICLIELYFIVKWAELYITKSLH